MTVNKKWIWNISADDLWFIKVDFVYIVDQVDSPSSRKSVRFNDPKRFLAFLISNFMKV